MLPHPDRGAEPSAQLLHHRRRRPRSRRGEGCRRPPRPRRRALALPRCADLDQGPRRHRRHREHARHRRVARPGARTRRRGDREDPGRGLRVPRQDGGAGVRPAQHQRAARLPAGAQPVEPRPQLWRFVRRGRGGPGVGDVPDLARLRRRRLDPQPVVVVRCVRPEAAARPHLARAESAEHVLARRSDHAHGGRRRRAARRDAGLRHRRRMVGAAAGAPLPRRSGRRSGEAPRRVPPAPRRSARRVRAGEPQGRRGRRAAAGRPRSRGRRGRAVGLRRRGRDRARR